MCTVAHCSYLDNYIYQKIRLFEVILKANFKPAYASNLWTF